MHLLASCESLVEFNFVTLYGTYFDTDYVIVDRDTQDVLTLQQTVVSLLGIGMMLSMTLKHQVQQPRINKGSQMSSFLYQTPGVFG